MGPRQHQYAGQNGVSRVSQNEISVYETIDEGRSASPWSLHKNKKQASGKKHAFSA
jgi:hypothetical protein